MAKTVTISGLVISEDDDQFLQEMKIKLKRQGLIDSNDKREVLRFIIRQAREQDMFTYLNSATGHS